MDEESRTQGARDAATVLPFVAALFVTPPLVHIFAVPGTVFGVPLILVYLFSWWAGVIGCAFVVERHLPSSDASAQRADDPQGG